MSLPIRTYNLRRTHGRNVSNSLGIQLALLTKMLPHNGDGAYGSVTSIVAPAQVPVTQAATGRSIRTAVHINMAASIVEPLAGFPNEAANVPQ